MKGIYYIENIINGKRYYGSSMNVEWRLEQHRRGLRKDKHINVYLQRSYNLHGIDNFSFALVEDMGNPSRKELHSREQWYIDNNKNGYNIAPANGGDTLSNHPDRETIIEQRTENYRLWLKSLSADERKERFSKPGESNPNWRNGGRKLLCSACLVNMIEPKANTCGECRDRSGKNNPFYNKKHTEETLKILRSKTPWTKGATPEDQSYTKQYEIIYPDNTSKQVYGLKVIAEEFKVSIANVHATISRMSKGKIPTKSVFKGCLIKIVDK